MLGWTPDATAEKVDAIYDTILEIFQLAKKQGVPTYQAADKLAERRIAQKA